MQPYAVWKLSSILIIAAFVASLLRLRHTRFRPGDAAGVFRYRLEKGHMTRQKDESQSHTERGAQHE